MTYDVIIRDGLWFDGTGSAPQTRTLGIRDGVVADIVSEAATGPLDEAGCPEVIDAKGKWVVPGFVDVHTHYDAEVLLDPGLQESVRHGVTTVLLGMCSLSTVYANSDAAVSVTATPLPGLLQRNLDFAVTVTNNGPGLLRSAAITSVLPSGLTAAGSGPCLPVVGQVICTVPTLAKGASTTMHFTVPLRLLSIGLPYKFTTSRTSSVSRDLNPANDSASRSCTVITPLLVNCV